MEAEPWMRATWSEVDPLRRGVIHALELCKEDAERWAAPLSEAQMFSRPAGLPPVAFHLRHIAGSLDRLLTYAEDASLSPVQLAELALELQPERATTVWAGFREGLQRAIQRVVTVDPQTYSATRGIGRQRLPTTVGGLLLHCAEHSQRHSGQMVTTAKLVVATTG